MASLSFRPVRMVPNPGVSVSKFIQQLTDYLQIVIT